MYKKMQKSCRKELLNYNSSFDLSALEKNSYNVKMLLANYSMPALLKRKPSNLFIINKSKLWKDEFIRELEFEITRFDCRSFILYEDKNLINILIYNEELLFKLLLSLDNENFLVSFGYQLKGDKIKDTLHTLKNRFGNYYSRTNAAVCFPHEIGIILGYPIQDVEDFIRFNGKNYILSGGWKVYHNAEEAVKKLEEYKNLRQLAIQMVKEGRDLKDMSQNI